MDYQTLPAPDHPDSPQAKLDQDDLPLKHQTFCEMYVKCGNAAQAARDCGYAPGNAADTGWRILQHPRVAERIRELQLAGRSEAERIHDEMINKLEHVYELALAKGNLAAAVRAIEAQGRLRMQAVRYDALKLKNEAIAGNEAVEGMEEGTSASPRPETERVESEHPAPVPEDSEEALPEWYADEVTLTDAISNTAPPVRTDSYGDVIQSWADYLIADLDEPEDEERDRIVSRHITAGTITRLPNAKSCDPFSPDYNAQDEE